MRRSLVVSTALLSFLAVAPAARAQTCSNPALAGDACAIASDYFRYMGPQLGTAIAGGSHTLGIGTNLGGFPHFAIALRANGVLGNFPVVNDVQAGGAVSRNFEVTEGGAAMVTADFALGLTRGFSLGVTRIGGVDFIAGATYVPEVESDDASITPQGSPLAIGYGLRVGLLQQSALVPGVAVSYMKRNLPTLDLAAAADDGSQFNINDLAVNTTSWRLSAQKNLLLFQLTAGIGGDTYDLGTNASVTVDGNNATFTDAFTMSRTTMYAGLGINLLLAKIVIEGGQVSGGSVNTFNTFDTPADDKRLYVGAGIRISF